MDSPLGRISILMNAKTTGGKLKTPFKGQSDLILAAEATVDGPLSGIRHGDFL